MQLTDVQSAIVKKATEQYESEQDLLETLEQ